MTTLLCLCKSPGMYCAWTAARRCASSAHHRILCCFSLTWQNCNEKKAVIWLCYLDCTYQNSSFAFATLTLDCIWHFQSIMLENFFSVVCKIGEIGCAEFPKFSRERTLLSTYFFNLPLVCSSISFIGCNASRQHSYATETCSNYFLIALLQCQQLCWGPYTVCTVHRYAKGTISVFTPSRECFLFRCVLDVQHLCYELNYLKLWYPCFLHL